MEKPLIIKNLEKRIGTEIHLNNNPFHFNWGYNVKNGKITGLGIPNCYNLELHYLKDFIDLEILYINNNRIKDVSILSNFPNLKEVNLANNEISDIRVLEQLPKLKKLNLYGNPIYSESFPEKLKKFQQHHKIIELEKSLNQQLTHLESYSDFEKEFISDYGFNKDGVVLQNDKIIYLKVTGESWLNLTGIKNFKNFKGLENFSDIKYLSVKVSEEVNLSGIEKLTNLEILEIQSFILVNTHLLEKLPKLKYLSLVNKSIESNAEQIQNLTQLIFLKLNHAFNGSNQPDYHKIKDISGLKNLRKLKYLDLERNEIKDINVIKDFNHLLELNINNNKIVDISPIELLEHITVLNLRYNKLTNILPLNRLKKLVKLDIYGNPIQDISLLENVKDLEYLEFNSAKINDISPLLKLEKLIDKHFYLCELEKIINEELFRYDKEYFNTYKQSESKSGYVLDNNKITVLCLQGYKLTDISFIKNFKDLIYLNLSENQIEDITPLKDLVFLEYVNLNNNKISDISILKQLPNLKKKEYYDNPVVKLIEYPAKSEKSKEVLEFEKLIVKELNNNNTYEIKNGKITKIILYMVYDNSNFNYLTMYSNLEYLKLISCKIKDLSFLEKLVHLKGLVLSNNEIENINSISKLRNLIKLDLSKNRIKNISAIKNLYFLEDLDLSSNHIEDASCIQNLKNLKFLSIFRNPKQDASFVFKLPKLETHPLIIGIEALTDVKFNKVSLNEISILSSDSMAQYATDDENNLIGLRFEQQANYISELLMFIGENAIENKYSRDKKNTFSNLIFLNLAKNNLENYDLEYLSELHNLMDLSLADNGISDISPLKGLHKLRSLDLSLNCFKILPEWICDFKYMEIRYYTMEDSTYFLYHNITGENWHNGEISFLDDEIIEPPVEVLKLGKVAVKKWFMNKNNESKPTDS